MGHTGRPQNRNGYPGEHDGHINHHEGDAPGLGVVVDLPVLGEGVV